MASRILRLSVGGLAIFLGVTQLSVTSVGASSIPTIYSATNAGYNLNRPEASGSVSGSFKVPTISGCTAAYRAVAVGVVADASNGHLANPFLVIGCRHGSPLYRVEFNMSGTLSFPVATVSAGDKIALSASMTTSSANATFTDTTTGFSKTMSGPGGSAMDHFLGTGAVHNPPLTGVLLGVPQFATFSITSARIDGATIGTYTTDSGFSRFVRTSNGSAPPGGTVQVLPGAVHPQSFGMDWQHS